MNGEYYHVYNRGIDRRTTFTNVREYKRALDLMSFYQYNDIPLRYSHYQNAEEDVQLAYLKRMRTSGKIVEIVAYCLMPNHFHLLVKQKQENGIATYIGNMINAYTKYFNKKYQRTGALFQGVFKAVHVETDDQLAHLIRYIHLNPIASSLITINELAMFPWSSHQDYLRKIPTDIVESDTIFMVHKLIPDYEDFIIDQITYAKELERIKHMTFEYEKV